MWPPLTSRAGAPSRGRGLASGTEVGIRIGTFGDVEAIWDQKVEEQGVDQTRGMLAGITC